MNNNFFQFGNTYWHQLNGTAMGVSPSCAYATLYFAAFEEAIINEFPEITLYKRYIDDIFGIWTPLYINDNTRWLSFQKKLNSFGRLRWELSQRTKFINYLDMTITITSHGTISTKLYYKPENMHLYLPATSSHPPSVLKGLIFGMVYRTLRLTSHYPDQQDKLQQLVRRLVVRGYKQSYLVATKNAAYQKIKITSENPSNDQQNINTDATCFLHSYYHPNDPKSYQIQRNFQNKMVKPPRMYKKLENWLNHRKAKLRVNRMIIAYHRAQILGNFAVPLDTIVLQLMFLLFVQGSY
jgi:hypothetical protein